MRMYTSAMIMMMMMMMMMTFRCVQCSLSPTIEGGDEGGGAGILMDGHSALQALLADIGARSHCSKILLTDGTTSSFTFAKVEGIDGGMSILQVDTKSFTSLNLTYTLTSTLLHARKLRMNSWCLTLVVVSDDMQFLTTFATTADNTRLLVWSTNVIVMTQVQQSQLHNLMSFYWVFSMMNTVFLSSENGRWGVYSHLPYTSMGSEVVKVARWDNKKGLRVAQGHTIFPQKYKNFHGSAVNMTVFPFAPYWMVVENEDGSNYTTGRDYIILETIARALNFSINVLPLGEWEEVMGRLETRTALISPIKLAIMPHLLDIYDFTLFIERATLGFTMAKPTLKPRWQSLYYPLTDAVWASILAALLIVPAIYIAMAGRTNEPRSTWRVIEVVLGSLLGHTITGTLPHFSSTRLLVATWLIFGFIVDTAYRSNLTAFLTVPKYPPRPENFVQLMKAGSAIMMPHDMVDFYNNFKTSDSLVYQTLMERVTFVDSFKEGMQEALVSNTAYIYERLNNQLLVNRHFTNLHGMTRLYVNSQNVLPDYCAWPLARDLPFKPMLDTYIMACHGGGLITKWTTDVLEQAKTESRLRKRTQASSDKTDEDQVVVETSGIKALTLVHMQGPLFLFLLGIMLSFLTFGFEVITLCLLKSRKGGDEGDGSP